MTKELTRNKLRKEGSNLAYSSRRSFHNDRVGMMAEAEDWLVTGHAQDTGGPKEALRLAPSDPHPSTMLSTSSVFPTRNKRPNT